ncbi:MAG TPA: hypothetical protein PKX92_02825 [Edaphocola sp.]|nr:hypothetical protein [Edaphocola sp.]
MCRKITITSSEYRHFVSIREVMAEKKSFMLRMDAELFKALERWAADEFRSINGQVEFLLTKALKEHKRESLSKKDQPSESEN